MMFRKKPVLIEARQLVDANDVSNVAGWCGGSNAESPYKLRLLTRNGLQEASLGDWIIRQDLGEDGVEFYPVKPDVFAATYEYVPDIAADGVKE